MPNSNISGLTAATTPLVGTEVLPIIQSGSTVKVANNDLRPTQIQSNSNSGILQITGPGASTTRVMTTPNANFTVARTDASQTFAAGQIFNSTIGIGGATAASTGSGITFPATQSASTDVNTLDDYEEGTWTVYVYDASSGGNQSATTQTGRYTKVGNIVRIRMGIGNINTSGLTAGNAIFFAMPFESASTEGTPMTAIWEGINWAGTQNTLVGYIGGPATRAGLYVCGDNVALDSVKVSEVTSGNNSIIFDGVYQV